MKSRDYVHEARDALLRLRIAAETEIGILDDALARLQAVVLPEGKPE